MKFYTTFHQYYCGIDLHARLLYVCILDERGNKVIHQKIKADPHQLRKLLEPYIGQIVVGVGVGIGIGSVIFVVNLALISFWAMPFI